MDILKYFNWKKGPKTTAKALGSYGSVGPIRFNGMGQVVWIDDNLEKYVTEGYSANDIVYSILSMCAEKERMAPWNVYKVKEESSLKRYEIELSRIGTKDFNLMKVLDLRTKALELYTGDGKLNELLQWPNEEETFQDLVANSGAAKRLTGNRYIRASMLEGGANGGKPQELYLVPSQYVEVYASRTYPSRKLGYKVHTWVGEDVPMTLEEILHDKTWNPCWNTAGGNLVGMAPLKAAAYNLTRSKYAKQASTYSFQNLGPDTIIFVDDQRLQPEQGLEQAAALKAKLYEEYSGTVNRKKMAASGYKVGAVNLGLSPVDLAILEAEKWDANMLANVFGFPHVLLYQEAATHDNMVTSGKQLLTNCTIPMLTSFKNHFNRKLQTDWGYKDSGIVVDFDLGVYSELQPDKEKIANWVSKVPMTVRQKYEQLQIEVPQDYVDNELIDKIMIPMGTQFLDDLDPANLDAQMNQIDGQQNQNEGQ